MSLGLRATAFFLFFLTINAFSEQKDPAPPPAPTGLQGEYQAILTHEKAALYQIAKINLSVVGNTPTTPDAGATGGGKKLKLAANVRIFFGEEDSAEFLIYQFNDLTLDPVTGRLTLQSDENDVSFVGFLRKGVFSGDWFSKLVGRVGTFSADRSKQPEIPNNATLVKAVGGSYIGKYTNTNPACGLPALTTVTLVTTQDLNSPTPTPVLSGNTRFYWGGLDTFEYEEAQLSDFQFNFYRRDLTMKAKDVGITFKGKLSLDGVFTGTVYHDSLGKVGTVELTRNND